MTELYQVVSIVGKGLGIVATKFIKRGALILKEGEFSRIFVHWAKKLHCTANSIKYFIRVFVKLSCSSQHQPHRELSLALVSLLRELLASLQPITGQNCRQDF